jgi:hypothetical protein
MQRGHDAKTLVYTPSRFRLLLRLLVTALFGGLLLLATIVWVFSLEESNSNSLLNLVVPLLVLPVALALSIVCLAIAYRMVRPRPVLIVLRDGITDMGSFIYGGIGRIRWSEISRVKVEYRYLDQVRQTFRQQFLVFVPANFVEYVRGVCSWSMMVSFHQCCAHNESWLA